ncbi:MAG: bis(5'-nucleosyl)-tetraphosphatase (symmetrical) YqeK [Atopobiaceae bacterium]|nr:bis(5'-nucleosyl)-tetraphosphatase (symmetrical) YqeK [Atopobiaceae bacterium]MBR3315953.1 bis(5'-nucleosyl)-tetraphosphatase (symmetrical) YqeK [Atopobiaceae bacterium]
MARKNKTQEQWKPLKDEKVNYEPWQLLTLTRVEADTRSQLAPKPRRLEHSLSVARTAEHLAVLYDVDPYLAKIAGLLHDWDKVVPHDELIERARHFGIDLGVPLESVEPLLHGMVAARELPQRYPHIPREVWHAIDCHTSAAEDMGPLDMVLFVADGIEPLRHGSEGIEKTRSLVGNVSLEDVFWNAFVGGIVYVLEGGRYLLPRTIDIYNTLALSRARRRALTGERGKGEV